MNPIQLVIQWQHAFGVDFKNHPEFSSKEQFELQMKLLKEEIKEAIDAFEKVDLVEYLDALCDIAFVANGLITQSGFQSLFHNAYMEVFRSNMSKLDKEGKPVIGEDGKILKSELYQAPDLKKFIDLELENKKRYEAFQRFIEVENEFEEFLKMKEELKDVLPENEEGENG